MRDNWCATCGAYVEHDPYEVHHILRDARSDFRRVFSLRIQMRALLRLFPEQTRKLYALTRVPHQA